MNIGRSEESSAHEQAKNVISLSTITLIPLPRNSMRIPPGKAIRSNVVTVTHNEGGDVRFAYNYWADTKIVTIEMNLHFQPGTVREPLDVYIELNTQTLTVDFLPSTVSFMKDVILGASAKNLDLSSVPDGANVHLYYINDPICEKISSDPVKYNKTEGSINLTGAHLEHFSQFGFGYVR